MLQVRISKHIWEDFGQCSKSTIELVELGLAAFMWEYPA